MGSISHHITPLVINSLGGGHTHTHILKFVDRSNTKKPGVCRPAAAAPGLKISDVIRVKIGKRLTNLACLFSLVSFLPYSGFLSWIKTLVKLNSSDT